MLHNPAANPPPDRYPVQELCRRCSLEEVAYLRWHGQLPTREQLTAQNRAERAQRVLDPAVARRLSAEPPTAHPVDTLRTAVTLIGAGDPAASDNTVAAVRAKALRLFALLPAVVAGGQRARHGLGAVAPRTDLGYAANFLYMTFGKVPEPQLVHAFETSLILYAEHSPAAPAFAGRVGATYPDLYSAVAAAVGALREPPQAGASESVMDMLNEIGIPDNARPWLEEALASGRKIPGFCHRGAKDGDPRVPAMRTALGMICALRGGQDLLEVYEALAEAAYEARGLRPHLDYAAAPAYHLIGFDHPAFGPVGVAARLPGWTAYIAADRLDRPFAAPARPAGRPPVQE
jgi:citrate synthase